MPPRGWRHRIIDILGAIAKIDGFIIGLNFESFCADDRTVDAVVRNIGIIGEAMRTIPAEIMARYPEVAWAEYWGMRNGRCPSVLIGRS